MTPRSLMLAGVATTLAVAAASAASAGPGEEAALARFSPPTTPMSLTRTLYRALPDGKQVVVMRRYAIRFSPDGDGYRIDGELLDTQVDCPDVLASLAEIERRRPDTGLFPASLDSRGHIRGGGQGPGNPASHGQALAATNTIVGKSALPSTTKRQGAEAAGQVVLASAGGSAWPAFLFNPGARERVDSREVALPDGSTGNVEVRVRAEGLMANGLPGRVERIVTTRLSGSVRVTREVWTLAS